MDAFETPLIICARCSCHKNEAVEFKHSVIVYSCQECRTLGLTAALNCDLTYEGSMTGGGQLSREICVT